MNNRAILLIKHKIDIISFIGRLLDSPGPLSIEVSVLTLHLNKIESTNLIPERSHKCFIHYRPLETLPSKIALMQKGVIKKSTKFTNALYFIITIG